MRASKAPRGYDRVSKTHGVSLGNIFQWMAQQHILLEEACRVEATMLLGVKARALTRKHQCWCRGRIRKSLQPLMAYMRRGIEARKRAHRPATLAWVQHNLKSRLQALEGQGHSVFSRGKVFQASRSFIWGIMALQPKEGEDKIDATGGYRPIHAQLAAVGEKHHAASQQSAGGRRREKGARVSTFETSSEAATGAGATGMAMSAATRLRRVYAGPPFQHRPIFGIRRAPGPQ